FYKKIGFRFVSTHPMFGPTFANVENLSNENAVVISESDSKGAEFFKEFFSRFGIKLYDYSFDEHDRMMAYSLSTPFVSTLVFAACMDNKAVPGTTFARHMAIAKGLLSEDDWLLSEILFNPYTIKELEKITSKLEHLKHIIRAKDNDEMRIFLAKLRKNVG
ncbi:prephenate dehydrogenase/arogenate dehydrogenase family protein, partial [Candidatus Micrarchaeota archaeon]|nr:prephenate dehydrogenase/arogenate dehydrogenase family protein [Candidatus Micrarchaeota archaeon]